MYHAHLQQVFDTAKTLQDKFVARIQLDTRLAINALGAQFSTQLAFGLGSVASRLARTANLTL
jgi:hypothetical protein